MKTNLIYINIRHTLKYRILTMDRHISHLHNVVRLNMWTGTKPSCNLGQWCINRLSYCILSRYLMDSDFFFKYQLTIRLTVSSRKQKSIITLFITAFFTDIRLSNVYARYSFLKECPQKCASDTKHMSSIFFTNG